MRMRHGTAWHGLRGPLTDERHPAAVEPVSAQPATPLPRSYADALKRGLDRLGKISI